MEYVDFVGETGKGTLRRKTEVECIQRCIWDRHFLEVQIPVWRDSFWIRFSGYSCTKNKYSRTADKKGSPSLNSYWYIILGQGLVPRQVHGPKVPCCCRLHTKVQSLTRYYTEVRGQ